jgi:hypothetical protein
VVATDDAERLGGLHLALEGAVEQLTHALRWATQGTELGDQAGAEIPGGGGRAEIPELERILGELSALRNQTRERLMRSLAKPSLRVLK